MSLWLDSFSTAFQAVAEIFLLGLIGWTAVRRGIFTEPLIGAFARLMVDLLIPCLLFLAMLRAFDLHKMSEMATMMTFGVAWTLLGMGLAWIGVRVWRHSQARAGGKAPGRADGAGGAGNEGRDEDRMILAMSGLQNAFYLPAPLVIALLPAERRDEGMMYVGAAVIILNFLQWTFGPMLLSSRGSEGKSPAFSSGIGGWLRSGLPPPVIGTLAGCIGSQLPGLQSAALGTAPGWAWFIELPLRALNLLTPSVGPLAMILLGGVLATGSLSSTLRKRPAILVVVIRLILVPALILWVARRWVPGNAVFFLVLAIEAAAPPATNLTIIALRYGNQARQVSSVLLVSYIVGLITIPLWIGWMGLGSGIGP